MNIKINSFDVFVFMMALGFNQEISFLGILILVHFKLTLKV